ncbi:MAG: WD40 repeat domain-containing protein [Planctomycetota bacterium]
MIDLLFSACLDLGFSASGDPIVSTNRIHIGSFDPAQAARHLGEPRRIVAFALSPDGTHLAEIGGVAGEAGRIALWNFASGEREWEREFGGDLLYDLAWAPDGESLVTAGGDGYLTRLALDGEVLAEWEAHSAAVLSVAIAPDGLLVSGSADRSIGVWRDDQRVRSISNHAERVTALAFGPDGKRLASASADGTVRVWQPAIGRLMKIIREHDGEVLDVLWNEHGLYSSCADGRVRELDDVQAQVKRELEVHDDWVERLGSFGELLVSQDAAGDVRQRRVTSEE